MQLKNNVIPSSVLAEKNTASLWEQDGHRTSFVLGSVGSDLTSCNTIAFSLEVWCTSFLNTHQSDGSASSLYPQPRQKYTSCFLSLSSIGESKSLLSGQKRNVGPSLVDIVQYYCLNVNVC